jgi:hypothetical protein
LFFRFFLSADASVEAEVTVVDKFPLFPEGDSIFEIRCKSHPDKDELKSMKWVASEWSTYQTNQYNNKKDRQTISSKCLGIFECKGDDCPEVVRAKTSKAARDAQILAPPTCKYHGPMVYRACSVTLKYIKMLMNEACTLRLECKGNHNHKRPHPRHGSSDALQAVADALKERSAESLAQVVATTLDPANDDHRALFNTGRTRKLLARHESSVRFNCVLFGACLLEGMLLLLVEGTKSRHIRVPHELATSRPRATEIHQDSRIQTRRSTGHLLPQLPRQGHEDAHRRQRVHERCAHRHIRRAG